MKGNVGNIAENELFVLTALMLIDDLSEAHTRISELEKTLQENNTASPPHTRTADNTPPLAEQRLEQTTRRIEQLAKLFEMG